MANLQLPLLWLMLAAYTGSLVMYAFRIWSRKEGLKKVAGYLGCLGLAINIASLLLRSILIKGLPLNNGFEFGLCFTFAIMAAFFIVEKKFDLSSIGIFVMPVVVAISCWLINNDLTVHPVMPALRSYWLMVHVSAAVVAYGAFAMSFAASVAYLVKEKKAAASELKKLDEVAYKMVFIGLPFLTIMLVTGSVWAQYAWGAFWSWDPKETWALITWLVYAAYLHTRFLKGFKGRRAAILSVAGFAAIIFTLFGVGYLMLGMHSYL